MNRYFRIFVALLVAFSFAFSPIVTTMSFAADTPMEEYYKDEGVDVKKLWDSVDGSVSKEGKGILGSIKELFGPGGLAKFQEKWKVFTQNYSTIINWILSIITLMVVTGFIFNLVGLSKNAGDPGRRALNIKQLTVAVVLLAVVGAIDIIYAVLMYMQNF